MKKFGILKENRYESDDRLRDAAEDDYSHIEKLKKDAHHDHEEREHMDEGGVAYKRDKDYGGNKGDKPGWEPGNKDAKAKMDRGFEDDGGPKDDEPLMEEEEKLQERVFQEVMKILKGK